MVVINEVYLFIILVYFNLLIIEFKIMVCVKCLSEKIGLCELFWYIMIF